jgi:hypothetical protein
MLQTRVCVSKSRAGPTRSYGKKNEFQQIGVRALQPVLLVFAESTCECLLAERLKTGLSRQTEIDASSHRMRDP